jgi:hypothetical protein
MGNIHLLNCHLVRNNYCLFYLFFFCLNGEIKKISLNLHIKLFIYFLILWDLFIINFSLIASTKGIFSAAYLL